MGDGKIEERAARGRGRGVVEGGAQRKGGEKGRRAARSVREEEGIRCPAKEEPRERGRVSVTI